MSPPQGRYDLSTGTTQTTAQQTATKRAEKAVSTPASRAAKITGAETSMGDSAPASTEAGRTIARDVRSERTDATVVGRADRSEAAETNAAESPDRSARADRLVKPEARDASERSSKAVPQAASQRQLDAVQADATQSAVPGRSRDDSRQAVSRQEAATADGLASDPQANEVVGDAAGQITINGDNNTIIYGDVYADDSIVSVGGGHYPAPYRVHPRYTLFHRPRFHRHWWYWSWGSYSYYVLDNPWNSCGWVISVPWRSHWGVTMFYPSYHRRYVFFSVGGYWPSYYRYRRYYWYGCHPYRWYGTYVYERPVVEEIHNYYYNTYETPAQTTVTTHAAVDDFSDVRTKLQLEKLQAEVDQLKQAGDLPNEQTTADRNFDQAVQAFLQKDYDQAVLKFRVAMILEPDDMILPFAYSQALFAQGEYNAAVGALRAALNQLPQDEDKQTVFYPRGLYEDDNVLNAQADALLAALVNDPTNPDLNLLYAYHMLGLGQIDKVANPLAIAAVDPANQIAVEVLTNLLEKVKADRAQMDTQDAAEPVTP